MRYELTITAPLEEETEEQFVSHYDYGYGRINIEVDEHLSGKDVTQSFVGGLPHAIARAYNQACDKREKRLAKVNVAETDPGK